MAAVACSSSAMALWRVCPNERSKRETSPSRSRTSPEHAATRSRTFNRSWTRGSRTARALPPVTIADLLRAALRHRPDRILVGEVRGAEAFDLLQALNTGHLGSLSTIHANSAEQAFTRLAHCVLTANVGLPHRSTREAIALAIHLVVHIARVGSHRRVTEVVAVREYDGNADGCVLEPRPKERPVPHSAVL